MSNSGLNEDQKAQLNTLLSEYSDLFANHSYDSGRTHLAGHEISVENVTPVKQRPYRVSHVNEPKIQQHLPDMLQHDIIRPSQSPWSSPIIIIGKKDGGSHFVVDYRQLNSLTRKDSQCTFQFLRGCQGQRTGMVTTVSSLLILGGWVIKILKNGNKN